MSGNPPSSGQTPPAYTRPGGHFGLWNTTLNVLFVLDRDRGVTLPLPSLIIVMWEIVTLSPLASAMAHPMGLRTHGTVRSTVNVFMPTWPHLAVFNVNDPDPLTEVLVSTPSHAIEPSHPLTPFLLPDASERRLQVRDCVARTSPHACATTMLTWVGPALAEGTKNIEFKQNEIKLNIDLLCIR